MAKDGNIGQERDTAPANDHPGDAVPPPMTADQVRAVLRPLVHLLARQAAREWLHRVANDNTSPNPPPSLPGPLAKESCPNTQE